MTMPEGVTFLENFDMLVAVKPQKTMCSAEYGKLSLLLFGFFRFVYLAVFKRRRGLVGV